MEQKERHGWREVKLGDVVDIGSSKRIFYKEYVDGGIPFYRSKEIIEKYNGKKVSTDLYISKKKFEEIKNKFGAPTSGDILLTSIGTLGIPYIVESDEDFYFKDGNLLWFKNFKKILNRFLYYWLISPVGREELQSATIGSTQPALTIQGLKSVNLNIPPISEQKAIAEVLSSLDDKIDLLHRQNKTLEDMAQALFRKWFVEDADEGWEVGKIEDLTVRMNSGGTPSTKEAKYYNGSINWFSTKELQDKFLYQSERQITSEGLENSSAKLFPRDTVLMSIYAAPTVGRLGILDKQSSFNQAAVGLVAKKEIGYRYIFLLLKNLRKKFHGLASGAAQQNLNVELVKNFPILIPDQATIDKFNQSTQSIFDKVRTNQSQIRTLERLRDILLPKLMNGKMKARIAHSPENKHETDAC